MSEPEPSAAVETEDVQDDAVIGQAFRRSLVVIVLIASSVAAVVWWSGRASEELPTDSGPLALPEVRETPKIELPQIPYTDATASAGIDFVHENGAAGEKLLPETMGGGCGFLDYNGDGYQDILLVNSQRWPWDERKQTAPATLKLYRGIGLGEFEDVTEEVGLDVSLYGMGCAFGDYDNDGDRDIFITAVGPNRLFRNDDGKFTDVTAEAGVAGPADEWSTSCGWFDYDNDGDLDLFVCNYLVWSREFDLAQNFQLTGLDRAYGRPQQFEGTLPQLYRNDGNDRFTDVSEAAGVQVRNPATGRPMAKSLGVAFADFDEDGWMDVIVANDTVQNFLFHNQGDGTFTEIGARSGVAFDVAGQVRGAMGVDVARFRSGEAVGIAIGNFANEMTALYVSRPGQVQFTDEAVSNGLGPLTRLELTFGTCFLDADLDGRLDVLMANGHLEDEIHRVQPSQHYEQPPRLFWNVGPQHRTEFLPLTAEQLSEEFGQPMVGRGAAYGDVDNDGDLDILLTSVGGPCRLLLNGRPHGRDHWLRLELRGTQSNRDAIGAVVSLHTAAGVQYRSVSPTCSYLSQVELPVTFGLGPTDRIDRVEIRWPSGVRQVLENPSVNQTLGVNEPAS